MPADRTYAFPEPHPGMDHDHYDWSPLNATRAKIEWPNQARVALCVIVTLEHAEWKQPPDSYQVPNLAGGYGWGPFPDVTAWSHREYGHRVGIFRVLECNDDAKGHSRLFRPFDLRASGIQRRPVVMVVIHSLVKLGKRVGAVCGHE